MNQSLKILSLDISNTFKKDGFSELLTRNGLEENFDYFNFHKYRFDFILEVLKDYFKPGSKFLDIGSFNGYLMMGAKLIGYEVSGTDLKEFVDGTKDSSSFYGFNNLEADLSKEPIPYSENKFDVILFSETLEHLNFHPADLFKEISRVLKPGGLVIITTPNLIRANNVFKMIIGRSINHEIERKYNPGAHYREYSFKEIKYLCEKAGLKIFSHEALNFKYPDLSLTVRIVDCLSVFFPRRKRDLFIIAKK
jgi:2-polyprenyl-3-methyl-5-hydroxy-6-metoxy-1,4-benzoquinol methylase